MSSIMYKINFKDIGKGLIMAILSGALLPLFAMAQSPEFNIANLNWEAVYSLAANGAALGFISYIIKNFFSDDRGRFIGTVG